MSTPKYTIYIVSRGRDHHYPVLMANNGKVALNEPSGRAAKLELSAQRLLQAAESGEVAIERITEDAFKAKFPTFAPNKGGKKKWPQQLFKKGDKVVVDAGVWGKCKATVVRRGAFEDDFILRITEGKHKGHEGAWQVSDIKKA